MTDEIHIHPTEWNLVIKNCRIIPTGKEGDGPVIWIGGGVTNVLIENVRIEGRQPEEGDGDDDH